MITELWIFISLYDHWNHLLTFTREGRRIMLFQSGDDPSGADWTLWKLNFSTSLYNEMKSWWIRKSVLLFLLAFILKLCDCDYDNFYFPFPRTLSIVNMSQLNLIALSLVLMMFSSQGAFAAPANGDSELTVFVRKYNFNDISSDRFN